MSLHGIAPARHDEWATPPALFAQLAREFPFDLDACASRQNAKCPRFYTVEDDGLSQPWRGVVWCNPPYGTQVARWVAKAAQSARDGATVVCLLPARPDTSWWHEHVIGSGAEVRFIKGRISFYDRDGSVGRQGRAPFPSAVVVFRPDPVSRERALLIRLAPIVARAMTEAGHLAQIVTQEHRGNCSVKGCTPDCLEAQQVAVDLRAYLKETRPADSPSAGRAARRAISPMSRRARAVPGRVLPPAPGRRRPFAEAAS